MNNLIAIAGQFTESAITHLQPLGNGLINDTFLVTTAVNQFVLQRVNRQVFLEPELISANLTVLNRHVKQFDWARLTLPEPLPTHVGAAYHLDGNGEFWRGQSFITGSESLELLSSISDAEQTGFALGHFHRLLSSLDPDLMHDTLPGFHIAPGYLSHYQQAASLATPQDRFCADFIARFEPFVEVLEQAKQDGLLPLRVTHGDPKLNNFLFDRQTRKIISLVDLDTVKPGLVHCDIADCLRSCCHSEETDSFDLDICEAILGTYLTEARHFFTASDYDFLYPAIRLLAFELGLRFYTDYLQGDLYFKVAAPGQNLQRATKQFRLCADIMAKETAILTMLGQLRQRCSPV